MGIKVSCVSTYGEQPIGHGIGPALEARELLHTIHTGRGPADLIDKVSNIASILFDFRGIKNGKEKALHIISSRMACKKFMEIVEAQGGDPNIKPEDIPVGDKVAVIKSNTSGKVWWVSNRTVTAAARAAGAPKDKGAGVLLYKKMGDHVEKGEKLLEIYAEKSYKLTRALEVSGGMQFMGVGKKFSMVLEKIPQEREHERLFILER
jgi:AMP phosphorylase